MIDRKNKLIFIHLEKTGGTSIEIIFTSKLWWPMLNDYLLNIKYDKGHIKHISLKYAKEVYKQEFNSYKKFCIVRHPYTMYISKYYWMNMKSIKKGKRKITRKDIRKLIKQEKSRWRIKTLYDFLENKAEYDFVIYFENYKDDYYKMLKKFNLDINKYQLQHIFKNNNKQIYKSLYLSEQAKKIIKKYRLTYCQNFGYTI